MAEQTAPKRAKNLRACYLCGIVKATANFKRNGCENCEEVFNMRESDQRVGDCTSANFDNTIAMMQPSVSWVARWQRVDKFVPGLYAMRVGGQLSDEYAELLADRGIDYRPRDGSDEQ